MFNLKNSSNVISKILLFFSIILISTNTVLASKKPTAENEIKNDKCTLAINYIKRCYTECQNKRSFSSLPEVPH